MNYPKYQVGDIVRLVKGWTPMTVIGLTPNNEVIAQYGTFPDSEDLKRPMLAPSTYTRPHGGFVRWDGKPIQGMKKMAKRYQVIGSPMIGKFMQLTTQGLIALEFDDATVGAFESHQLVEFYPTTFAVKAVAGNQYKTHYIQPEGVEVKKGDMLFSNSGSLYVVIDINTKNTGSIRVFEGQRLMMAPL